MRAIFISYRREDAEGHAGRLFDDLVAHFGEKSVFMDVAGIEPGRDFRRAIDEQVASCGVLLAVIGKTWLDATDASGRRRLDDPMDFVRLETSSALKRDIPVIPVLVRDATMPRAEQLPADLVDLAYRNSVELTHARWDSDVQVLIKALQPHVGPAQNEVVARSEPKASSPAHAAPAPNKLRTLVAALSVVALLVAVIAYFSFGGGGAQPDSAAVVTTGDSAGSPAPTTGSDKNADDKSRADLAAAGNPEAKSDSKPEVKPVVGAEGTKPESKVQSSQPSIPTSYTLAGTWEKDNVLFAVVPDPKENGAFEMEQVKPREKYDRLWKARLKDRDVDIDMYAMPSGTHQVHMSLQLSLDGNRMVGLLYPGGASPDFPPESVSFRRVK